MLTLEQIYLAHDLVLLRAIAKQAGLELSAPNPRTAALELAEALKKPDVLELLLDRTLKAEVRPALAILLHHAGRQPVASFGRRFGEIRPLGPAALIREQPWDRPANVSEALFFNGLIGRAFMDSDTGPQEFFYIATDLLPLLPELEEPDRASPALAVAGADLGNSTDPAPIQTATTVLGDDSPTLLSAQQPKAARPLVTADLDPHLRLPVVDFLNELCADLGLIGPDHKLDPEKVKPFLNATRAEQLQQLAQAWHDSKNWNDLLQVPTLHAEPGAWHNDPILARAFILKLCADLPAGEWRSLESFVTFVREHQPDFQRPAGDYDSWYIREAASGAYLRGFENWDKVDGALIRFLITGPLHWLGLADVRNEPAAFRLTPLFTAFINQEPWPIIETPQKLVIKSEGTLLVAPEVNRFDRFQAARIGAWLPGSSPYVYRITGNSLQTAGGQGITAKHILAFLRRASDQVPDSIVNLIERWGQHGIEVRAFNTTILKLTRPEVLEQLMRSPQTRRWLGEALGDRAVEVKDWEKLREAMTALGITAEVVERRK